MADRLDGYHLFHATRAELLTRRGDHEGARAANARALELTDNPAEQALLHARLDRPVHADNTAATDDNTDGASTNTLTNTRSPESCSRPRWGGCHGSRIEHCAVRSAAGHNRRSVEP